MTAIKTLGGKISREAGGRQGFWCMSLARCPLWADWKVALDLQKRVILRVTPVTDKMSKVCCYS